VCGPFDECNLYHHLRLYPVRPDSRQAYRLREGRLRKLRRIEARTQFQQEPGVESRTDFPREHELVAFEIPDQQRAQSGPLCPAAP